jgi:chloride channel protein, CIC family
MKSPTTNPDYKARFQTLINKFLFWRLKNISNRNFLIIASIIVGIISALAAIVLKLGVHSLQYLTGVAAH